MCRNTLNVCAAPVPGGCYVTTADIADLQSDWRVENVQRKPEDSAQVHQTIYDQTIDIIGYVVYNIYDKTLFLVRSEVMS